MVSLSTGEPLLLAAFTLPLLLGSLDWAAVWLQRLRHWWWEIARSACCSSVLASINPRVLLWLCFPISHSCPRVLVYSLSFCFLTAQVAGAEQVTFFKAAASCYSRARGWELCLCQSRAVLLQCYDRSVQLEKEAEMLGHGFTFLALKKPVSSLLL